jgi:6-phosphogluconolactonase (cycloisomerase 2 family)
MRLTVALWTAAAACGRIGFTPEPQPIQDAQTLYIAGDATVAAYRIDPTSGTPMALPGSPFASAATKLTGIALDASGRFVVVSGTGPISLASYAIDPVTGALAPAGPAFMAPPLNSMTAHPGLPAMYSAGDEPCAAYQLDLDLATGAVALGSMVAIAAPCSPAFVSVDPMARWIFLPGEGSTYGIDVGALDANGKIVAINRSGHVGADTVASISDPSGRFLYVADDGASGIFGYAVDQMTGALPAAGVPGTPAYPAWSDQNAILFDPSGTSLYVFDDQAGVYHFSFDSTTGGIAASPPTTDPANAGGDSNLRSAAFSRDGATLYGVDGTPGLHAFTVDPASGLLAALPGAPFPTPEAAHAIAISR